MKRLLLGVGNRLSRDDGVGPAVAERLTDAEGWRSIDCGIALENASGIVSREQPDLLVIVDAARMGLQPGAVRTLPSRGTDRMLASTHGLPLTFILDRLRSSAEAIVLIGIEPKDTSFGEEGLTSPVAEAAERLNATLRSGSIDEIESLAAPITTDS